jgi:transposase
VKLSASNRSLLEELRYNTRDKKVFIRCSVILMVDRGYSYEVISDSMGVSLKSVQRCVRRYEKQGVDGLVRFHYVGRQSQLTPEQEAVLQEELREHLYTSTEQIQALVKEEWDIVYSRSGLRDLLHRLGFVYKKTKILPGKADAQAQQQFVTDLEEILEDMESNEAVYYLDGCHPTHNTRPSYGWIVKGEEHAIRANTGRKRVNLNGAVNALDPTDVYVDASDTVNAQSTQVLIQQIIDQNPDKETIYLISDNARYYHAKILQEWLENHPQIVWVWLPPYSPNLNLIERLWGFMQRKILNGIYYETYEKFKKAIHSFFQHIGRYRKELASLMTLNFQIIDWNKPVIS